MQQLIETLESEYGIAEMEAQALVETVGSFFRRHYVQYRKFFEVSEVEKPEPYRIPGQVNPGLEVGERGYY